MRVVETKRFSKTLKKLLANGLDGRLVADAVRWLVNNRQPPCPSYRDHALGNNLKMWRELHLRGDLLLVYQIEGDALILILIGSHNQVFNK